MHLIKDEDDKTKTLNAIDLVVKFNIAVHADAKAGDCGTHIIF